METATVTAKLPRLEKWWVRGNHKVPLWLVCEMKLHIRLIPMLITLSLTGLITGCAPAPTPTPATLPTGIPYVDKVIQSVQSGDLQAFKAQFVLRSVPCTKEKWLLRQPLCAEDEPEGTIVQTMPLLSDDLGHLRVDDIKAWHGLGDVLLYAVYRTGDYTYSDEFYPAGEYAVVFVSEGSEFAHILQVTQDGIVRIDFCGVRLDICNGSTIEEISQENESAFILGPLPVGEVAQ